MAGTPEAGAYETRAETEKTPSDRVAYWAAQEKLFEKEAGPWRRRGRKVVKRYRDERPENAKSRSRFNVLWANVQVLKPTLYARTPKPDVAPRWLDQGEGVVRLAAKLVERGLSFTADRYDIDSVLRSVVEDRLLPGAGFARVRYKPTYGEPVPDPSAPEPEEGKERPTYRPLAKEDVCWEYVFWEDAAWGPARRWEEVPWLRFRSYLTRDELTERFTKKLPNGKTIGETIPLDWSPKGGDAESGPESAIKKAVVHEYWDKTTGRVEWVAPGYPDDILDQVDDPLELDGFFPCPKPLFATTTNDRMVPVPDFVQYQDQADELDSLTARIDRLTRALKVAGVYAASEKAHLQRLLEADDNTLLPVEDWAVLMQKGGLEGAILWLPIKDIAAVLIQLYDARDRAKQTLYEISGLSDIMRGLTNAQETLGAQQLKSQYGTIRVADSQKDVARFARDLYRLAGQVFGQHFDPKTISAITGLPELPKEPPKPVPPPALAMGAPAAVPGAAPTMPQAAPMPGAPAGQGGPVVPAAPDPALVAYQQQVAAYEAWQAEVQRLQNEFAAACALLKDDALRTFRIDIEADSTIAPDEEAEKKARVEYLQAIGSFLQQAQPLVQAMPREGGELVAELLKFATHAFRAGRPVQEVIDRFADALKNMPPPSQKTDPALVKVEKDAELAQQRQQAEADLARQRQAAEAATEQQRAANEAAKERNRFAEVQTRIGNEHTLRLKDAEDSLAVGLAKVEADKVVRMHGANLDHEHRTRQLVAKAEADRAAAAAKETQPAAGA